MSRPPVVLGLALSALWLSSSLVPHAAQNPPAAANPMMVVETAKGAIEIEMLPASAPKSVAHVMALAKGNFYRGQRVHWIAAGVVQFGDPQSRDMTKRDLWGRGGSGKPIGVAEPSKGPFVRGSVGMGYRANLAPATADSQIFILTGANANLNGKYAMIGRVKSGIEVADKLALGDVIRNVAVK